MTCFTFPSKWEKVELSDIAIFQNGYAFKSSTYIDSGDFVIRIGNVHDTGINLNNPAYVNATELNAEKFRLSQGDILMSLTGNVGRTAFIKEEHLPAVLNQRVAKVAFSSLIEKKFSFYLLRSNIVQSELLKCAKGAAQLNISTKDLDKIVVGIPSIREQKIIAEKLDTLLAQVDSTKARLEQIPQILKRFRQAVLAAVVNGKAVNIDTDENTLTTLGNIAKNIKYGTSKKCSETQGSTAVLRIPNIGPGYIINSNLKYADFDQKELVTLTLKEGDLLLIRSNGSVDLVGKVAVISENDTEYLYAGYLIRVRLDKERAAPKYISYCLQSPQLRQIIENIARSTSGVNNINSKELASLEIPLTPLPEQHEIVRRVEQLFAWADTIEKQVNSALTRVNSLTQSILAKAFRGELTAQWRAENPSLISGENSAAALLEKIKAERAASGGKKTSRKKA
ncbi:TPA: restriction endonuclease subunit S [Salmonella enterica]|uniref:4'-phosphopantetheinyl transferase n=4 Tax=Salmonella enterica TaxID=28901 RepID=A0A622C5N3_SALER|nr:MULTISPECIES: restriction endonuclease subunit S [Salmonella]EAA5959596.1 4'-phosphopantetheinyl transferase [Salmonella enterica subsp. enterica serovar Stanleyville]EBR8246995.1 4'-phosphopantetheinyl transferase [Salmonella enterica subsp. enterica serovar Shubra]EBV5391733.1 4'-phosphopantetheinyl transferase [Salmonella enterica subsp. enterica serovar Tananarive]EBZ9907770.1 4'-phosphopantetheinyl transferase [Salmonella enterica subsp. enterica serovar Mikawasima]ECD2234966.1 4'-phos